MTKAKHAPKKASHPEVEAPAVPTEITEPAAAELPAAPTEEEARTELMQTAKLTEVEDPRPMAVIAEKMKADAPKGKTLFITKSKDQAVVIMANGNTYTPIMKDNVWVWSVADEDADMFSNHTHVQYGRIVRALGK